MDPIDISLALGMLTLLWVIVKRVHTGRKPKRESGEFNSLDIAKVIRRMQRGQS